MNSPAFFHSLRFDSATFLECRVAYRELVDNGSVLASPNMDQPAGNMPSSVDSKRASGPYPCAEMGIKREVRENL